MKKGRLLFGSVASIAIIAALLISAFVGAGGDDPQAGDNRSDVPLAGWIIEGTYLKFGVNDWGTFIEGTVGFQYPKGDGYESLRRGTYTEGYLVAYTVAGTDHQAYHYTSGVSSGIAKVSAAMIKNDAMHTVVRVVTKTTDNVLEITTTFEFQKEQKYLRVKVAIKNISGGNVEHLIYKRIVDWDVHGDYYNEWSNEASAVYAKEGDYIMAVAGTTFKRIPCVVYAELYGFDDKTIRGPGSRTPQRVAGGTAKDFDGVAGLTFDLGRNTNSGGIRRLELVYSAAEAEE